MRSSIFDQLFSNARVLSGKGEYGSAADLYLEASRAAVLLPEKAESLHCAARCFGLIGSFDERERFAIESVKSWRHAGTLGEFTFVQRRDFQWMALLASITSRRVEEQECSVGKFIDAVRTADTGGSAELASYIEGCRRAIPPVAAGVVKKALICFEAELRESVASSMDSRSMERELSRALALYGAASDEDGVGRVRGRFYETSLCQGRSREKDADFESGSLIKARIYEEAARLYGSNCPDEAARCRVNATMLRRQAELAVVSIPGYGSALFSVSSSLGAYGSDAANREASGIHPLAKHRVWLGKADDLVAQRDSLNLRGNSEDQFFGSLADLLSLDLEIPVIGYCLRQVLATIGESESYCPTPTRMPWWVVTTRWPKTLVAAVTAGVAGGVTGLTTSGMDVKGLLVGVVGAECGLLVNLLSTYLTQGKTDSQFTAVLKRYEPKVGLVILCLARNEMSATQLAGSSNLTPVEVRRILRILESDGVIVRSVSGQPGGRKWTLKE